MTLAHCLDDLRMDTLGRMRPGRRRAVAVTLEQVAGHRPFSELRDRLDGRLAAEGKPAEPVQPYWADLRFVFDATSLEAAADHVERVVEAAKELGFELELGHTTSVPPVVT